MKLVAQKFPEIVIYSPYDRQFADQFDVMCLFDLGVAIPFYSIQLAEHLSSFLFEFFMENIF